MSDITEQQMDDLIQTLNKSAGSLGKIADKFGTGNTGRANARDQLRQDFNMAKKEDTKQTKEHFAAVKKATSAVKSYAMSFTEFAVGAGVLREVWKWGSKNIEVYRDLSDMGQSFGGSMIRMAQAAGDAGIPLQKLAKIVQHNSVVVKQMGEGPASFMSVQKNLRQLTESSGLYGYSLEDLGTLTLDYMNIQRIAGKNLAQMNGPASAAAIQKFALGVTGISDVLGAERKEVMKQTMELMTDGNVAAKMRLNTIQGMDGYNQAMTEVVADLRAQPGKAGEMLGSAMSETFGSVGGALFTDLGKKLADVGQGGAMAILDEADRRVKAGENAHVVALETVKKMSDALNNPETLNSLNLLASTGDASAKEILAMATSLKKYTLEDVKKAEAARKNTDMFTAFMGSFESVIESLKGAFIKGFLEPFMTMGELDPEKVKKFWKQIEDMAPVLEKFGVQVGGLITQLANKGNVELIGSLITGIITVGRIFVETGTFIIKMMNSVFGGLHKALSIFSQKTADVGTGLAVIATWFAGKALIKLIGGGLARAFGMSKIVTVNGQIVNVNGGSGGGSGGIDDLVDEGGGKAKRGTRARGRQARQLRKLRATAKAKNLTGAAAREFVAAERGGVLGKAGRLVSKVPGAKSIGGMAGKLMGVGKAMSPVLKTAGKWAGPIGLALAATFSIAEAANSIKDIQEQVAAGKMTPEEGRKAIAKLKGSTAGSLVGSVVGGFFGSALGPLGTVGGAMAGGWVGEKLGGMAGVALAGSPPAAAKVAGAAGLSAAGTVATPGAGPTPAKPEEINEDALLQTRTDALLGNEKAITELKRIQEALDRHTAIIATQQAKTVQAAQATTSAVRAGAGM